MHLLKAQLRQLPCLRDMRRETLDVAKCHTLKGYAEGKGTTHVHAPHGHTGLGCTRRSLPVREGNLCRHCVRSGSRKRPTHGVGSGPLA